MIRGFMLMAAWFLVFPEVVILAGAWQSQAHPTTGVHVVFKDGTEAVGRLSRGWDQRWILVTDSGASRFFSERQFTSMTFPAPDVSRTAMELQLWRAWLPPLVTGFIFMMGIFWPWLSRSISSRANQSAEARP